MISVPGCEVTVERCSRKSIAMSVTDAGKVRIKAPLRCTDEEIMAFIGRNASWLREHLRKAATAPVYTLTEEQIRSLADAALRDLPPRVRFWAGRMGVSCGRVTIRNQLSKWGSCTGGGNLNFNCLLMLAPAYVRDYIVVHELSHRVFMNHSAQFWALVAKWFPDYRLAETWLKTEGAAWVKAMRKLYGRE